MSSFPFSLRNQDDQNQALPPGMIGLPRWMLPTPQAAPVTHPAVASQPAPAATPAPTAGEQHENTENLRAQLAPYLNATGPETPPVAAKPAPAVPAPVPPPQQTAEIAPGTGVPKPAAPMPAATAGQPASPASPAFAPMGGLDTSPAEPGMIRTPPGLTPAAPTARQANLTRLENSKPGDSQIHNPFLRTLAQIGDAAFETFAPRAAMLTPGNQMHHNMLLNQARNAVGDEQAERKAAEEAAAAPGLRRETEAKAANLNSEAQARLNPPEGKDSGKTVTTDQGILQLNHKTGKYDIKVGNAPAKEAKETGTVHQLDDGSLIMAHPDGTASPVTVDGKPVKGPAKEKPVGSPEQQFIDEYRGKNPQASIADAEKAFKQLTPKEPVDRGQNFIDPSTHRMVRVEPGGAVPEGALTPAGVNTANTPTSQMRARGEMAKTVTAQVPAILSQIDALKSKIGPAAGRWNQLWVNKGGMDDPDFAGLDQDLKMLASGIVITHFGMRANAGVREALEKNFGEAQSPDDLKSRINHADKWLEGYAAAGKGSTSAGTAPARPKGVPPEATYDATKKQWVAP